MSPCRKESGMASKFKKALVFTALSFCCLLTACGLGKIKFDNASLSRNSERIAAVLESGEISALDKLSKLKVADLSGSRCYEEICAWAEAHPDVYVHYTVELPAGTVLDSHSTEAAITIESVAELEDTAALLKYLPRLKTVTVSCETENLCCKALGTLARSMPDVEFQGSFKLCGKTVSTDARHIKLSDMSLSDVSKFKSVLPAMFNLETVDLASDKENPKLSFADIKEFQECRDDVEFLYGFNLYGRDFSLNDKELDLSYTPVYDEGLLVRQAIACMPELEVLDMDSCGVSNEAMAEIRDDFPDIKVVWRVWFGDNYCVRTDVEKILASRPTIGGNLVRSNTQALKYCTEVKYLDVGHNDLLEDISFISYMPKLEVAILAMGVWSDTRPIADCPNLEYLEIQTTCLTDLTPLSGLTKLKHLNICYLYDLTDITPLYPLTQLERLWIGCLDPVPQEQIDEMQRRAPQCEINTTTLDPTEGGWRYRPDLEGSLAPRYALLREQFGYDKGNASYAFPWNDPKYQ